MTLTTAEVTQTSDNSREQQSYWRQDLEIFMDSESDQNMQRKISNQTSSTTSKIISKLGTGRKFGDDRSNLHQNRFNTANQSQKKH